MAITKPKRSRDADDDDTQRAPPGKRPAIAGSHHQQSGKARQAADAASTFPLEDRHPEGSKPPLKAFADMDPAENRPQLPAQPPPKRPADDETSEPPRPRKRPGASARISTVDKEAFLARQRQRQEEALKAATTRGIDDAVREHYNAVPQRGRDWRSTESRIKGLRKFNNWVKSTIIHRFSSPESGEGPPLRVLDIGCGNGGDRGKCQAEQHPN